MPGDLDAVPRAQFRKNLALRFLDFLFNEGDLLLETDAHGVSLRVFFQLLQLALQLQNRLFKIKLMFHEKEILKPVPGGAQREFLGRKEASGGGFYSCITAADLI